MDNKKVQKKKKKPQNKAPFMKAKKKTPEHYWKKSAPHHVEKAIPEQSGLTENAAVEKASIKAESPVADPIIQEETHKAQIPAADPVSALTKGDKKLSDSKKKEKATRTYEEICADLSDADTKNASSIDRYVSLFLELLSLKNLTSHQVQFFFASVNELIGDAWSPFLAKVSTHVSPVKQGNERLVALELIKCCHDVLESCGLSVDDIEQACRAFCESKDSACVTDFLKRAEMVTPFESADGTLEVHKITPQELACVTFMCFNYRLREFSPSSLEPLVRIDRAIAEHFSKPSLKDYAGKTLGSILASKVFSTKKITELVYLYDGTTSTILHQAERIDALQDEAAALRAKNTKLAEELESWKGDNADLTAHIEALEKENARYRQERTDAERMLEYERNKFERQMQSKEAGIAEQLAGDIELEIQAIRETTEYIDEDNQRRIRRRLQRIDDILQEFGGASDA